MKFNTFDPIPDKVAQDKLILMICAMFVLLSL